MTSGRPPVPPGAPRPPLLRATQGRQVAGVCAGLAAHLGVTVAVVRAVFVALALVAGAGVVVYAFLWVTVPQAPEDDRSSAGPAPRRGPDPAVLLLLGGLGIIAVGVAVATQLGGLNMRLDLWGPLAVVVAGAAFAWFQLDDTTRRAWVSTEGGSRHRAVARIAVGLLAAVAGLVLLTSSGAGIAAVGRSLLAALVVLAGVGLVLAPWVLRLWRDLRTEQAERIRATERADIAAHLHDSVLQTLALIQRHSGDPVQVSRLARAQERELRDWLYGQDDPRAASTLAAALREAAAEVEDRHGVAVELIVTGDRGLDDTGRTLTAALREALTNAVRHGAPPVAAYVEIGRGEIEAFIRDHGPGFDPDAVPDDRLGVRESIIGRLRRHGGAARFRFLDPGTEVQLSVPLPTQADPGDNDDQPDASVRGHRSEPDE